MEYLGVLFPIDPENEKNAIIEYIRKNWKFSAKNINLEDVVDITLAGGIIRGIAFQEREMAKTALAFQNFSRLTKINNPNLMEIIENMRFVTVGYEYKDFPDFVDSFVDSLTEKYGFIFAEPIDYKTIKSNRFNKESENNQFRGHNLHPIACKGWPNFIEVMDHEQIKQYDEIGLNPFKTMTVAILRQGISIGVYCVDEKYGKILHPFKYKQPEK